MISFANIRKTKGHTVSLFMMFLIAAILLNAGLLVFVNFGSFFEKITTELNTSNVYYIMPSHLYNEKINEFIKNNDNVLEMQKEDSVWTLASVPYNKSTRECNFLINDADNKRELSKWKFVGEHLATDSTSIFIPYVMKIDGGYNLNDKFVMTFKEKTITFTIKGFTDDALFSSLDTGILGVYLPHETFQKVHQELGDKQDTTIVFANLKKVNKDMDTEINEIIKQDGGVATADDFSTLFSLDLSLVRMSRTIMASIISVMLVAFSAIISIVCLIVVKFRIGNSIEDDMTKIGSLKAVGYTSRQIISSVVTQFTLIAIAGSIVGIALSYLTTPALSDVFAHQSGLMWVQGFDGVISSIVLLAILLVVIIVSLIAARRINKLNPIVALRGGITTHSFRKNHMPLNTSRGSLPMVLAFKSILQNMKQSLMIAFILAAVSFASTFSIVMFYNTMIDTTAFAETPGIEISNALAVMNPETDNTKIEESIKNMSGVWKTQYIDETMVKYDNTDASTFVMDDYSKKETNTVYEGRYPLHSNEVVLAGQLANMIQKDIGDSVTLKIGDKQASFIITGLSQGSSMGGLNASIRSDGLAILNPNFKQQIFQIYLNKETNAAEFVSDLKNQFGDSLVTTIDMDKSMEQGMGVYISVVSKVGIVMLFTTILVVILVLYFVINSLVIRKKRELGIQKAIGFTTFQLMNQLSLGFLPPIIIGVFIGSLIGITQTNTIMSVAQRSMGIMKANFIITPVWIALFGACIVILSYITSMLITYSIRKISAYALVSE